MREIATNRDCFFGLPFCGFGFESSRHCFIACPSEEDSILDVDVIKQELEKRDYGAFVAVEQFKGGKNVFCTKICSQIITSHFCIALLNSSGVGAKKSKSPNPNVHFEYGMMSTLGKHIIPMARIGTNLSFNISPLDTLLYSPKDLREKIKVAIDAAIAQVKAGFPPPGPAAPDLRITEFMSLRGLVLADVTGDLNGLLYGLGGGLGFFLFAGAHFAFVANMQQSDSDQLLFKLKLLSNNILGASGRFQNLANNAQMQPHVYPLLVSLQGIEVYVICSEQIDKARVRSSVASLPGIQKLRIEVHFCSREEVNREVEIESSPSSKS